MDGIEEIKEFDDISSRVNLQNKIIDIQNKLLLAEKEIKSKDAIIKSLRKENKHYKKLIAGTNIEKCNEVYEKIRKLSKNFKRKEIIGMEIRTRDGTNVVITAKMYSIAMYEKK